ncbi:MAG: response regulator, partial [Candidatus Acidiferrum sp.]
MAKILVADDNSNIQKMVGLALKDQGIEVVAVGNGEAAVRKIPDLRPDLVLADVFMPVRTGYEVCEFVKKDPTLSHIPVILLVGAFDPLDEQEAQRVGADGVLKKPFVPPDPLIAMVKAALTRAGVSLTGSSDKGDKSPKKASEMLPARPVPLPMSVAPPVVAAPPSISIEDTEGLVEEVAVHPAPVTMPGGAPLAFGNLMGTAEAEEDPGFTAAVHPELTVERDWRAAEESDEVPEEEEEDQPKASWRRDADDLGEAEPAAGVADSWRETGLKELSVTPKKWEAPAELPSLTEAA